MESKPLGSLPRPPACSGFPCPFPLQMGFPSYPSSCSLCGPGRMPLFISPMPLPFDSLLSSISADLCVLGIQLGERTERVTAAPNPASAALSTPAGAAGVQDLLVMPGPVLGFVGISCPGWGWGALCRWDQQ